jgi:hypothetical protein
VPLAFRVSSPRELASVKTLLLGSILSSTLAGIAFNCFINSLNDYCNAQRNDRVVFCITGFRILVFMLRDTLGQDTVYSATNAGARIPPNTNGLVAFALMFLHPVRRLIG